MAETTFKIGADASCTDGPCGTVIRVVVNPVQEVVTHLVVEPPHREAWAAWSHSIWSRWTPNRVT
jgi:hypothetical protein